MMKKDSSETVSERVKIVFSVKENLSVVLKLTVVVAVVSMMLAVVNTLTRDRIAVNERKKTEEALSGLFPASEFDEIDSIPASTEPGISVESVYTAGKNGVQEGCCVELYVSGFSTEEIHLIIGVAAEEYTVVGVEVISSSETPGVGAAVLAKNGDYLKKFENTSKLTISDIDTVSGATITSEAVVSSVRTAVNIAAVVLGGDNNG